MPALETIYVALLNEPAAAWHPVQAAPRAGGLYLILSRNDDPETEQWEFSSGTLVRCETRVIQGTAQIVAVERIAPQGPRLVAT